METAAAEAEMSTLARSSRPVMISVAGAGLQAVDSAAVSEDSVALAADRSEEEELAAAGN